jgi:hypothetical protein
LSFTRVHFLLKAGPPSNRYDGGLGGSLILLKCSVESCDAVSICLLTRRLQRHFRLSYPFLLFFRNLSHCCFGQQQDAGNRHGVLKTNANDFGGVDDAGLDQIDVLLTPGIKAFVPRSAADAATARATL